MTDRSEEVLIELCQKGDLVNFASLYDFYIKKIYDFIYFKTHHKQTAEDLTASTFLKALENIKKYDTRKGKFSSWLYRIARNSVIDHYRTQKHTSNIEDAWDLSSGDDVASSADFKESIEKVKSSLNKLNAEQRDIVILRTWSELSYGEISQIVGKSEANCKVIFSRAISKLKDQEILTILILLSLIKLFN